MSLLLHHIDQRFMHARHRTQSGAAIGIGADTWQHDTVCRRHAFRLVGQVDCRFDAGFPCRALERLGRRSKVAGAIIDNCHTHVSAFHSNRIETSPRDRSS